jgi:hypothetical protein
MLLKVAVNSRFCDRAEAHDKCHREQQRQGNHRDQQS